MTVRNLFLVDTLVLLGFGLPMMISPQILVDLYLTDTTPLTLTDVFIFRLYGLLLTSNGVLVFAARNAQSSIARKALLLSVIISGVGSSILHLMSFMQGLEKPLGWGTVLITAVLGIWALMLYLKEKPTE
jgi:hypothetical protein